MSILDSIQAAEANAEKAKVEASEEVKAMLVKAQKEADAKGAQRLKEAQVQGQSIAEETQAKLDSESTKLKAQYAKQNKDVASLADSRIDIAISYIMKKVVAS